LAKHEEFTHPSKLAFAVEDFESGEIAPDPGWLKEVWDKWPGDETIEEFLPALDGDRLESNR